MASRRINKTAIWVIGIFILSVTACQKAKTFSDTPHITNLKFKYVKADSVILQADFTDGDGNFGLDPGDTLPPHNSYRDSINIFYYNVLVDLEYKQQGAWQKYDYAIPLYYRIKNITPSGQNKTLEGTIYVNLKRAGGYPPPPSVADDSLRYTMQIIDRSDNLSNIAYTDPIP